MRKLILLNMLSLISVGTLDSTPPVDHSFALVNLNSDSLYTESALFCVATGSGDPDPNVWLGGSIKM